MSSTALQEAVSAMGHYFFDVTIICTTDDYQAEYWMDVLSTGLLSGGKKVLAVSEDWTASGGAGNGLGTLYAWKKACALATARYNFDLAAELAAGSVSAALYHTAGKGTRMAPLPASENNNKPGVVCFFRIHLKFGIRAATFAFLVHRLSLTCHFFVSPYKTKETAVRITTTRR